MTTKWNQTYDQIWNPSEVLYPSVEVRFPKINTPQEFLDMFIFHYALHISVHVSFIDSTNTRFLITKDELNDRLGDGPDEEMETSVWELGVLQGLRKGAVALR